MPRAATWEQLHHYAGYDLTIAMALPLPQPYHAMTLWQLQLQPYLR